MGGCARCGDSVPNPACGKCGAQPAPTSPAVRSETWDTQGRRRSDGRDEHSRPASADVRGRRPESARPKSSAARQRQAVTCRAVGFPEAEERDAGAAPPPGAGSHSFQSAGTSTAGAAMASHRLEYLQHLRSEISQIREETSAGGFYRNKKPEGLHRDRSRAQSTAGAMHEDVRELQGNLGDLHLRSDARNQALRHMLEQQRAAATMAIAAQGQGRRVSPSAAKDVRGARSRPQSASGPSREANKQSSRQGQTSGIRPQSAQGRQTAAVQPEESGLFVGSLAIQGQQHEAQRLVYQQAQEAQHRREQVREMLAAQERVDNMFNRLGALTVAEPGLSDVEAEALGALTLRSGTSLVPNKEEDVCAICLDSMTCGEFVRILACGHRFHSPCIKKWVKGKKDCVCPMCKQASVLCTAV